MQDITALLMKDSYSVKKDIQFLSWVSLLYKYSLWIKINVSLVINELVNPTLN